MKQEITVKNMVCPRCVEAARQIFQDMGLMTLDVQLGVVTLQDKITSIQKKTLKEQLVRRGFELLEDKQAKLVNAIKSIIIDEIHHKEENSTFNFSTLLGEKLHYDYSHLSRLFSSVEGQTIERFVLAQKTEKVKELLTYDEMSLSEIAFQMNYSSSAHLSAQFKKVTGMTPTAFKKLHEKKRKMLNEI